MASAFILGVQSGLLIGGPTLSALVGLDFGYQPGIKFSDQHSPGGWRAGFIVGTYIPFFDIN
jgi:hypothetical protein